MLPKQKASELIHKFLRIEDDGSQFYWEGHYDRPMFDEEVLDHAKKCALVVVYETLEQTIKMRDFFTKNMKIWNNKQISFLESVAQEIKEFKL